MSTSFRGVDLTDIDGLLNLALKLESHNPNGPRFSMLHKQKALQSFSNGKQQSGIFHLTESHFPSLRNRTCYRNERNAIDNTVSHIPFTLSKYFIDFQCDKDNFENGKNNVLSKIKEMPTEWTLVQMTAVDLRADILPFDVLKNITPEFYLTAFKCGGNTKCLPYCVKIEPPKLKDQSIELAKDIHDVISKLHDNLKVNENDIQQYWKSHSEYTLKLKKIISQMEFNWLKKWRFLLLGELVNLETAQTIILPQVYSILEEFNCNLNDVDKNLIDAITLGSSYLSRWEIGALIIDIIPNNKQLSTKLARTIGDISQVYSTLLRGSRHPVILILDQQLDYFPWESCEILKNHPVSRLPSIHFVYGLYTEYKEQIVNGLVSNIHASKGAYVVNPGKDLDEMEVRMHTFYEYWTPNWEGNVGEIDSNTYQKLLTNCDIFCYNGHGSGIQFLSGDVIQKLQVKGVVMLFGCESVALSNSDVGYNEMRGTYDNYLMACSACVVGNLYKVTSREMDYISTNLLSIIVPSKATTHWKQVDKNKWNTNGTIVPSKASSSKEIPSYEPELLRAVCIARQTPNLQHYLNEVSLIVRGLPVLIN